VAVLPLEYDPGSRFGSAGGEWVLDWDGDRQHLAAGFLRARTPTQLLTIRSHATESRLSLLPPAEPAGPPRIVNRLGTQISLLVVRTGEGRYHRAADVAPGATAVLQPLEWGGVAPLLSPVYRKHLPHLPPGMTEPPSASSRMYRGRFRFGRYGFGGQSLSQQTSILEKAMSRWGAQEKDTEPLARGSYVAIVGHDPEVLFGTPSAREESGFHVICGEW
jgi:hypothetical protein